MEQEKQGDSLPVVPGHNIFGCSGTMIMVVLAFVAVGGSAAVALWDLLFGLWQ